MKHETLSAATLSKEALDGDTRPIDPAAIVTPLHQRALTK